LGTDTKYFTASGSAATNNNVMVGDSSGGIKDSGTLITSLVLISGSPASSYCGYWSSASAITGASGCSLDASGNIVLGSTVTVPTIKGGADGTNGQSIATIRGANISSGASPGVAQGVILQGGDSYTSSSTNTGGSLEMRPGIGRDSADAFDEIPGKLKIEVTGVAGSSYNVGNDSTLGSPLGCQFTSGGFANQFVFGDCQSVTATQAWFGVLEPKVQGAAVVRTEGWALILSNSSATFTVGHTVCTDPGHAAKVVDNGSSSACPCPQAQVGYVWLTDFMSPTAHQVFLVRGACTNLAYSTSRASNTLGGADNTALGSSVNMLTPPADGVYNLSGTFVVTTQGTGGACTQGSVGIQVNWTDCDTSTATSFGTTTNLMFQNQSGISNTTIGAASVTNNAVGFSSYSFGGHQFCNLGGATISYQMYTVTASNCTTEPVVTFRPTLVYVGTKG
jgi:hypothetical protein